MSEKPLRWKKFPRQECRQWDLDGSVRDNLATTDKHYPQGEQRDKGRFNFLKLLKILLRFASWLSTGEGK